METQEQPDQPESRRVSVKLKLPPGLPVPPRIPYDRPLSYWLKKLLVCNPFYLVSAALLLYGFYLVSTDDNFPGKEISQLAFNFGSLQFYELLLVSTAIVLARRRIWYDSNLLIFLENVLVLMPFILMTQAALIDQYVVVTLCLVGGAMVYLRFVSLKQFHQQLNLPRGLLGCGLVLLLVNIALPLIFRHLHESKVGTKPTDGAAFEMNQCSWLLILPAMIALANCLPRPAQTGNLLPQRRWVPMGLFALWLVGSVIHLYCLGYVYNFDWEVYFIAPPLWALAWTVYRRQGDFLHVRWLRPALLIPPALVTLITIANSTPGMFLLLTSLNAVAYASIFLKDRGDKLALNLMFLSLVTLAIDGLRHFETSLPACLNAGNVALGFATLYSCYWIVISRQPKLGIVGTIIVGIATGIWSQSYFDGPHFAIQCALLFLLLHSLVWRDDAHPGAREARIVTCAIWGLHSFVVVVNQWPHTGQIPAAAAGLVLAVCFLVKLFCHRWPPLALPVAAALVILMRPMNVTVTRAQSTPVGLWVVAGSFLLFALGTLMALYRSKWNPPPEAVTASDQTKPEIL